MWQGRHLQLAFTDRRGGGGGGVTCVLQPPHAHTHAQASLMPFTVCNCIITVYYYLCVLETHLWVVLQQIVNITTKYGTDVCKSCETSVMSSFLS